MRSASSSALVWGACGFIGRHLVSELLNRDLAVSVITRPRRLYREPAWSSKVRWFELGEDGNDSDVLREAVASATAIYNLAGWSGAVTSNRDPFRSLDSICRSHLEFLEACALAGHHPHVVFPSSWLVYGHATPSPIGENHLPAPRSLYAAHKLCAERYLQIYSERGSITYTVCRISNPYGFDEDDREKTYGVINTFIRQGLASAPITLFGDGRQLRDYLYIGDLTDALIRCGFEAAARNEVFNISRGVSIPICEAVHRIQRLAGAPAILFAPWPPEYKLVESGDYVADISKAKSLLGFAPQYDFDAGLAETVMAYRAASNPPPTLSER